MAPVPQIILDLVARYERETSTLQSPAYGESNCRKEFVDPLFTALGWDVANVAQSTEAFKDVVNEYSLRIGDSHKAPDYAFRIGGTRTFFVEAKRPGVDITSDAAPAYQLRRYGWTANLPISVLTNFRDIAIYDCGPRPKASDRPSAARTLLIHWAELPERWNELVELLGKTAIFQGSLDRYSSGVTRRRGTSPVDDEFLRQMEQWRSDLASNIAIRNRQLSVDELNEAVQQTIDRLVFLRITEDRGIETYETLKGMLAGPGVYPRLIAQFRLADARYNSGLFHFRTDPAISGSPDLLTPTLLIDDKVLRSVIDAMYYPSSPYEFSVLPADILGQVYEQFLGKVIRLTPSHGAKVEEKPEVKKAGGVYYTPTWVVDHIVDRTLGLALEGRTPAAATNLKILDPACGSGSFLIGAYDRLLRWFSDVYVNSTPATRQKRMFQDASGEWRLTLAERKRILKACIFGVDIDRQAVEVTKLSLMLKVLEGQSTETINQQMQMFHLDRVLPDLDKNIQCGNSLVGSDATDYLDLDDADEDLLNPFDWDMAFPKIMGSGGFHVVIGNPPYDVLEKERGAASWPHGALRDYLPSHDAYEPALGGKLNLYRLFLIRSIGLTRSEGHFGMIVPMSLVADISTASTRRFVLTSLRTPLLECFPQKDNVSRRVFLRAKLSTVVVTGSRTKNLKPILRGNPITTRVFPGNDLADPAVENSVTLNDCALLDPEALPIPLTDNAAWELCKKIHRQPNVRRLADLTDSYQVARGEINQTVYREYISTTASGNEPLLKGVELGAFEQYASLSQGQREWLNEARMLSDHPDKAKPPGPRIATQRITGVDDSRRLVAALIDTGAWFADSTNSITSVAGAPLSLVYLVGLLNSELFQWRFRLTSSNNNVATNELLGLPIRVPVMTIPTDVAAYKAVCSASARVAQIKSSGPTGTSQGAIDQFMRKAHIAMDRLNRTVFDLYQIDADEQKLVEARLARSQEPDGGDDE